MTPPRCSCCYDETFDRTLAERELRDLRRSGPRNTARALVDALGRDGCDGATILDIGAGVGSVHLLLLERGAASAVDVDLSRPYLEVARAEAERRGLVDRVEHVPGDFTDIADSIGPADLVALDRVVCCHPDVDGLVGRAAERTRRRLGVVLPPDHAVARLVARTANLWERIRGSAYRAYVHPHDRVIAVAVAAGLTPTGQRSVGIWRLLTFERPVSA